MLVTMEPCSAGANETVACRWLVNCPSDFSMSPGLTDIQRLPFANLSQSELAQQAGVSVRTIQQYEQRRKDINKAQTETLLKIARALVCTVEDLVEKVPT